MRKVWYIYRMILDFERKQRENELIREVTRPILWIGLSIVASSFLYGTIAYFLPHTLYPSKKVRDLWQIFTVLSIFLPILVLAVRRTIYFSPRLLKGDFKLKSVLQKWSRIDLFLMAFSEVIAVLGLIISFFGMPFSRTYFFFVAAIAVTMILLPIPWKVTDKIRYFEKFVGTWNE